MREQTTELSSPALTKGEQGIWELPRFTANAPRQTRTTAAFLHSLAVGREERRILCGYNIKQVLMLIMENPPFPLFQGGEGVMRLSGRRIGAVLTAFTLMFCFAIPRTDARPNRYYQTMTSVSKRMWNTEMWFRAYDDYRNVEGYLSSNVILGIHEGRSGLMWFCTEKGIDIWNGRELLNLEREHGIYQGDGYSFFGYTSLFTPKQHDPNILHSDSSRDAHTLRALLANILHQDSDPDVFADIRNGEQFGYWVSIGGRFVSDFDIPITNRSREPRLKLPNGLYFLSLAETRRLIKELSTARSVVKKEEQIQRVFADAVVYGVVDFLWRNPMNSLAALWVSLRGNGVVRVLPQYGVELFTLPPQIQDVTTLFTDAGSADGEKKSVILLGSEQGLWSGTIMPSDTNAGVRRTIIWEELAPNCIVHHIIRLNDERFLAATERGVCEINCRTREVRERSDINAALPFKSVYRLALQRVASSQSALQTERLFVYHSLVQISLFTRTKPDNSTVNNDRFTLATSDIENVFKGKTDPPYHDMVTDAEQTLWLAGEFGVSRLEATGTKFTKVLEGQTIPRLTVIPERGILAPSHYGDATLLPLATTNAAFTSLLSVRLPQPINGVFEDAHSYLATYSANNRTISALHRSFPILSLANPDYGTLEFRSENAQNVRNGQTAQNGQTFIPHLSAYLKHTRTVVSVITADAARARLPEKSTQTTTNRSSPTKESLQTSSKKSAPRLPQPLALLFATPEQCQVPFSTRSLHRYEPVLSLRKTSILGEQTPFQGNDRQAHITPKMSEREICNALGICCAGDTLDIEYKTQFTLECGLPQSYFPKNVGFRVAGNSLVFAKDTSTTIAKTNREKKDSVRSALFPSEFTFEGLSDDILSDGVYSIVSVPFNTMGILSPSQDMFPLSAYTLRVRSPWWKGRAILGSLAVIGVVASWIGLIARGRIREERLRFEQTKLAKEKAELLSKRLWQETLIQEQRILFEREKAEREKQMLLVFAQDLQLRTIGLQMNPHFIFNAMSNIEGLIVEGKDRNAQKYIGNLSELMRIIFDFGDSSAVSLRRELHFLQLYLLLEQERMEYAFDFSFDFSSIPHNLFDTLIIPAMLIQPLIENALKHGIAPMRDEEPEDQRQGILHITLEIQYDENNNPVKAIGMVEDNGVGRRPPKRPKRQIGRSSILAKERLVLLQKLNIAPEERIYIDLKDENGKSCGTRASVAIPFVSEEIRQLLR